MSSHSAPAMTKAAARKVARHRLITDYDVYLFREGRHSKLYEKLGAHEMSVDGTEGTQFAA